MHELIKEQIISNLTVTFFLLMFRSASEVYETDTMSKLMLVTYQRCLFGIFSSRNYTDKLKKSIIIIILQCSGGK